MHRGLLVAVYLSLGTACTHATPTPAAPVVSSPHPPPATAPTTQAPAREPPRPPDHDQDALPDTTDRCPDLPEDHDGHEDDDGCPDRDNDGDGILDAHTWTGTRWTNCDGTFDHGVELDCRNLPEDFDGLWDADGCPDLITVDREPAILDIQYDPNTLKLPPTALDPVIAHAAAHPDQRYWIEVHCDSRRTDKQSIALTRRLALAVVAELVRRGVAEARLAPRPFGESLPIADNKTPAGRNANNRLEILVQGSTRLPAPPLLCPPELAK